MAWDGIVPGRVPIETLRIGGKLGRGGFAVCLRATCGGKTVALKVLHPEFSSGNSPEGQLFLEEARLMLTMQHPHVVKCYALLKLPPTLPGLTGYTSSTYAMMLEVMEGGSLASLIARQLQNPSSPQYTFMHALHWCIEVAAALEYLHSGAANGLPIIHRDVKLDNVLLSAPDAHGRRQARLADFGLQKAIMADGTAAPSGEQAPAPPSPLVHRAREVLLRKRSERPPASSLPAASSASFTAGNTKEARSASASAEQLFYRVGGGGLVPLQAVLLAPDAAAAPATHANIHQPQSADDHEVVERIRSAPHMPDVRGLGLLRSPDPRAPPTAAAAAAATGGGPCEAATASAGSRFGPAGVPCTTSARAQRAGPSPLGGAPSASASGGAGDATACATGAGGQAGAAATPDGPPQGHPPSPGARRPSLDQYLLPAVLQAHCRPEAGARTVQQQPAHPSRLGAAHHAPPSPVHGSMDGLPHHPLPSASPQPIRLPPLRSNSPVPPLPPGPQLPAKPLPASPHTVLVQGDSQSSTSDAGGGVASGETDPLAARPRSTGAALVSSSGEQQRDGEGSASGGLPAGHMSAPEADRPGGSGPSFSAALSIPLPSTPGPEALAYISVRSVRGASVPSSPGSPRAANLAGGRGGQPGSPRSMVAVAAAHRAAASSAVGGAAAAGSGRHLFLAPEGAPTPAAADAGEAAAGAAALPADYDEVFTLTGRTGSAVYMAPECYKNEPYNQTVDIYSFGILMYELFGRTSFTYTHITTKLPQFSRMLFSPDELAERTAGGYRPPKPRAFERLPPELWQLISACWHQDPVQRPDIASVGDALYGLEGPLEAMTRKKTMLEGLGIGRTSRQSHGARDAKDRASADATAAPARSSSKSGSGRGAAASGSGCGHGGSEATAAVVAAHQSGCGCTIC